jgi:hypothetical protein
MSRSRYIALAVSEKNQRRKETIQTGQIIMKAEKMMIETDQYGRILQQPQLPPNARMEAIFSNSP